MLYLAEVRERAGSPLGFMVTAAASALVAIGLALSVPAVRLHPADLAYQTALAHHSDERTFHVTSSPPGPRVEEVEPGTIDVPDAPADASAGDPDAGEPTDDTTADPSGPEPQIVTTGTCGGSCDPIQDDEVVDEGPQQVRYAWSGIPTIWHGEPSAETDVPEMWEYRYFCAHIGTYAGSQIYSLEVGDVLDVEGTLVRVVNIYFGPNDQAYEDLRQNPEVREHTYCFQTCVPQSNGQIKVAVCEPI